MFNKFICKGIILKFVVNFVIFGFFCGFNWLVCIFFKLKKSFVGLFSMVGEIVGEWI